jgi:GH25 family lysozyme M1 (1,4-beta-N-acetylmuramidase)
MFLGIDVSAHNGIVNVKQVRDAGYKYFIARAGYGQNNIDQRFDSNATACINLGMPLGIYWFSYAYTVEMAMKEASYAINAVKKYKVSCPIAYDLEYDSVRFARVNGVEITRDLATAMAKAFLFEVENAGYIPILYTNKDYTQNYYDMEQINAHIWYARYKNTLQSSEKENIAIWQKSNKGSVSGISGNVDINEFYVDFDQGDSTVEEKPEITPNINILNFQKAANHDGYKDDNGNKLVEDGIDDPKTQYVRKAISLEAKFVNNKYKIGSTGEVVRWWQTRLNEMGFVTKIDGKYGSQTRTKTLAMQRKYNLKRDGIAGYNSISTAFYN